MTWRVNHPKTFPYNLKKIIDILREKYKEVKIIVSEITPRKDSKDAEVIKM